MDMTDSTIAAVQQIRDLIGQAAVATEAIGPVILARLDDPDDSLDGRA